MLQIIAAKQHYCSYFPHCARQRTAQQQSEIAGFAQMTDIITERRNKQAKNIKQVSLKQAYEKGTNNKASAENSIKSKSNEWETKHTSWSIDWLVGWLAEEGDSTALQMGSNCALIDWLIDRLIG